MKINKKDLQESLAESLERHKVAGASVAVFNDGEVVTAVGGVTNVTTGVEVTSETVMHIGSITKVFNATLVMQLVDEGKIDLDERVGKYLPDLRLSDPEALKKLTVKMLLNHTSGIDGPTLRDHGHDEETIEKGIERIGKLPQLFPPGTEFSYSNPGVVIAGYLVQRLRGKSWYRLVRERIFEPLEMAHATTLPEEALLHRAGIGHFLNPADGKLVRTSFVYLPQSFGPAGRSLMMSASDLIAFTRAHIRHGLGVNGVRVLSEDSVRAMQEMTVDNKGRGYTYIDMGLGWMVADDGLLTHSGGGPGISSGLYTYPDRGFAAAILTNSAHGSNLINEFMEPWLKELGSTQLMGRAEIQSPRQVQTKIDPDKYVGVYENVTTRFIVSKTPDGINLSAQTKFVTYDYTTTEATPAARLIPLGNEQFLLGSQTEGESGSLDAGRIFVFKNLDTTGRMQHLGNMLLLRKRVS